MRRLIVFICFVLVGNYANSQDLTKDVGFFMKKSKEYQEWLNATQLSTVLKVDTIKVRKDKLYLFLKVFDEKEGKLCDKTNYDILSDSISIKYQQSLSNLLFEHLCFLMDLKHEEAEISINTRETFIDIAYEENKLFVDTIYKMGEFEDGYKIAIKNIQGINSSNTKSKRTISFIKRKLDKKLNRFFKKDKAYFVTYGYEVVSRLDNEFIIEVSNVKNIIIKNGGFFEYITISFEFEIIEGYVIIDYSIKAKYGAGIIWAPRSDDYYDMYPKYQEHLERFSLRLKNKVDSILKK